MRLSRPIYAHEELSATDGMVVAQHPLGARIGIEVLQKGGNAVDAAVTTAFAMGVLQPLMNGIGGGGHMVVRLKDGTDKSVAFPMKAAKLARPDMYELKAEDSRLEAAALHFSRRFAWPKVKGMANERGHSSIAVPGTVAGLALALESWGSIDLAQALAPAIRLADEGFGVGHHFTLALTADRATFLKYPATLPIYYPGGQPIAVGGRFVQKDHARTLRLIAKHGPNGFYRGETAERIAADCAAHDGTVRVEDLAAYRASVVEPLRARYRGVDLAAVPRLTAGTTVVEILNILENFDVSRIGWGKAETLHLIAEATRLAAADRFTYMGDAAEAPLDLLAGKAYAAVRAKAITRRRVAAPEAGDPWKVAGRSRPPEFPRASGPAQDGGTTHLTVVDRHRAAVALTQTNVGYSGVVNPGVGVMMNNAMSWFYPAPGTINSVASAATGLNNMTPILMSKRGKLVAALGASGGRRIWTAISQTIVNVVDFGMSLQDAVQAPRLHAETDDLMLDGRLAESAKAALEKKGHRVTVATPHFDRSPYSEPNGVAVAGKNLKSAVYPVAKPTYAAGYPGGDSGTEESDSLAPRPDLHP